MPIYEYECPACGERFELLVKLDAPMPVCPKCASTEVRKRVSAAAFMLKGSGWYKDHYGLKSSAPSGGDGSSAPKTEGAGGSAAAAPSAKTETAPAPAKPTATPASGS
jgi:putative FmdB family regulatory protein